MIFLLLGLGFVLGRYLLKSPTAGLFLVLLLTHELSMVAARVLKGVLLRLRPAALFAGSYSDSGFWHDAPIPARFPPPTPPSTGACFCPWPWRFPATACRCWSFPSSSALAASPSTCTTSPTYFSPSGSSSSSPSSPAASPNSPPWPVPHPLLLSS
ncbi:hypothetical protein MUN79_12455 [Hymenobacter cellulosilyticus]|uniref:Uncharacterized protein n=1 Tax=Hymenobacter cellulosilyticus TaxID=2932248 RepID=A0A8T9QII2_9BACT|nr:hypothetical protein [Hymenobacter cellulosilyticus]UOQ74603.1 hypothetical protein MUN79_12455 [Hymenobacter cellulosilyticus]